jgi:hypothetical protein
MWAFVLTFLIVAVLAGMAGWFLGNPRPTTVVTNQESTSTAEASKTVPTTVTVPATTTV